MGGLGRRCWCAGVAVPEERGCLYCDLGQQQEAIILQDISFIRIGKQFGYHTSNFILNMEL